MTDGTVGMGTLVTTNDTLYIYIRMTHYKLFSVILLTCKMYTSSINYQMTHYS
jgi:hypothetical protein